MQHVSIGRAIALAAAALVVGAALGWLGSGMSGDSRHPDLRALCATLGALDIAVLDRIERQELGDISDPDLGRLGILPNLAAIAASGPDVPNALEETGRKLSYEFGRSNFDSVREQVVELHQYC